MEDVPFWGEHIFQNGWLNSTTNQVIFQASCLNPILHLQETCLPDVWPHLDIAKTLAMQLEAPGNQPPEQMTSWSTGCDLDVSKNSGFSPQIIHFRKGFPL